VRWEKLAPTLAPYDVAFLDAASGARLPIGP
jgi:hypothetical protein